MSSEPREILERRLGLALDFQGSLAADLKQMRAWRNKWRTRTQEWREKAREAVTAMRALRSELAEVREQTAHLEKTLASTTSAWDAEVEARSKVARQTAERVAQDIADLRAQFDAATKRAELAEATLESVRAAVTSTPVQAVPWSEATEPGCLYFDCESWGGCAYLMAIEGRSMWLSGPSDPDLELTLQLKKGDDRPASSSAPHALLIARDLGTDPEAWRAAMREYSAKVGK